MPSSLAAPRARLPSPPSRLRRSFHRAVRTAESTAIEITRRLPDPARHVVLRLVRVARRRRSAEEWSASTDPAPHGAVADPQLTVVVTSRNRSELLGIALRSVQRQDVETWECVVVDDGSTDDAVMVAQSFAALDERFRVLAHDARRGPSAARNAGLAAARTPLVCFLDDDDFLLDGSLRARLAALADQPPDVAGAFCDWVNVDPGVGLEAFRPARRQAVRRGEISFPSLFAGTPFILSAPLLRTDAIRSVGGFDERFERGEDAELWLRLCRVGYRFVDAEHVGIAYRRSAGSLVTAAPGAQLDALAGVFAAADRPDPAVAGHGPLPAPEPLGAVAAGRARRGWILRYVAMIAATDPEEAVRRGLELMPAQARRGIVAHREAPSLAAAAAVRLGLNDDDRRALVATTSDVLARLSPRLDGAWTPSIDVDGWRTTALAGAVPIRAPVRQRIGGTPVDVDGTVVLIPEARYHVDELGPLGDELARRGVPVRYMVSPKSVPAAKAELGRYADHALPYTPEQLRSARAVVSLNDWGPLKEALRAARDAGVPTFAKVEGVQDFEDVESKWERRPYRSAAVILAQGTNDVDALPEQHTFIVGSSRLERIWNAPAIERGEHALVNLNFTFHVLTEQRDRWLSSVHQGLEASGVPGLVSRHPAERGPVFGLPVATKPFRYEITQAGLLVTRFSTVAFESIARGVPFVYHNPHGERFPTFQQPDGAFVISRSAGELAAAVTEVIGWRDYRAVAREFFLRQVDVDPSRTSAERAADVIVKLSS